MHSTKVTIIMFAILGLILIQQKLKLKKYKKQQDPDEYGHSIDNFTDGILVIGDINASEFELINASKESMSRIKWRDIQSLSFVHQYHLELVVNGNKIKIPFETINYFYLIRSIPTNIPNFDYSKAKTLCDALKPCEICGFVAVYNEMCCSCSTKPYQLSKASKKMSKEEYLREMQLAYFMHFEPGDTFQNFFLKNDHAHEPNLNWKPYVSEDEIMEQNKGNY